MSASNVNNALAEDIIDLLINASVEITLHTADPGEDHTASLTTAVDPFDYALADWAAAADHVASGGRRRATNVEIDFGNATAVETLTHIGVRNIAEGRFASTALAAPQATSIGNPVIIEAGDLGIIGAGLA